MLILTGVYGKLLFNEESRNFMLNKQDIEKHQTQIYHTIWRLFLISGKLMFFTTINNIFHHRTSEENPFLPLENPLCLGRCEAQNLAYLNEDNEYPHTYCCPFDEVKDVFEEVLDNRTKSEMHKLEELVLRVRA